MVYVMRGAFKDRHLLAEARRHLTYVLRGRLHEPGLDERIVRTVVDHYTLPVGRRTMTADLRALYPREIDDQAVLRPLTRSRSVSPYERARLAAGVLTARVHAVRRSHRLGFPPAAHRRRARRPDVGPAVRPRGTEGKPGPGAGDRRRHGGLGRTRVVPRQGSLPGRYRRVFS